MRRIYSNIIEEGDINMSNLKDEKYSPPNPGPDDLNKPTSEPLHVEAVPGATVLSQEASDIMNSIITGN